MKLASKITNEPNSKRSRSTHPHSLHFPMQNFPYSSFNCHIWKIIWIHDPNPKCSEVSRVLDKSTILANPRSFKDSSPFLVPASSQASAIFPAFSRRNRDRPRVQDPGRDVCGAVLNSRRERWRMPSIPSSVDIYFLHRGIRNSLSAGSRRAGES